MVRLMKRLLFTLLLTIIGFNSAYGCPLPPQQNFAGNLSVSDPIPQVGDRKLLVLLVDFSDQPGVYTQSSWQTVFFGAGGFADYYREVSYSKLNYSGDIIGVSGGVPVGNQNAVAYIRLPYPKSFYSGGAAGTNIRDFPRNLGGVYYHAIQTLENAGFDFTPYSSGNKKIENVIVIFAGNSSVETGNQNDLQPTSYSLDPFFTNGYTNFQGYNFNNFTFCPETNLYGQASMGVCAHEHGHSLGMPDLYDFNYNRSGVGYYDLMSYGTYGADYGRNPFHPSAFTKSFFGWLTLEEPGAGESLVTLPPIEHAAKAIKLPLKQGSEYFVIENRTATGFDTGLQTRNLCEGIYIWHIDSDRFAAKRKLNVVNSPDASQGPPYHLAQLVEGDGRADLRSEPINYGECSDAFSVGDIINDSTVPNLRGFDGSSSGFQVEILGQDNNGDITLRIVAPATPTPEPTATAAPLPTMPPDPAPTLVPTPLPTPSPSLALEVIGKKKAKKKTISGIVTGVPNVSKTRAELVQQKKVKKRAKISAANGKFRFTGITRGSYVVRVGKILSKKVKVK